MALKQIGHEQKIDLSQYFPSVRLEDLLKNVGKRDDILLKYLLDGDGCNCLDPRGGGRWLYA